MTVEMIESTDFDAKTSQGVVLLDFFAEWCGPCRIVAPVLEKISNARPEVKIFKIDVDKEQELTSRFRITNMPTLVLLRDGKETSRLLGAHPEASIMNMIDE